MCQVPAICNLNVPLEVCCIFLPYTNNWAQPLPQNVKRRQTPENTLRAAKTSNLVKINCRSFPRAPKPFLRVASDAVEQQAIETDYVITKESHYSKQFAKISSQASIRSHLGQDPRESFIYFSPLVGTYSFFLLSSEWVARG